MGSALAKDAERGRWERLEAARWNLLPAACADPIHSTPDPIQRLRDFVQVLVDHRGQAPGTF